MGFRKLDLLNSSHFQRVLRPDFLNEATQFVGKKPNTMGSNPFVHEPSLFRV